MTESYEPSCSEQQSRVICHPLYPIITQQYVLPQSPEKALEVLNLIQENNLDGILLEAAQKLRREFSSR